MTRSILVLGATGKSGRRLVPLLRQRGHQVRAASRRGLDGTVLFDWHRPETYAAALSDVDAVYLTPPELVVDPSAMVAAFLDQAVEAGVGKVVAVTSMGVEFPNEGPGTGRYEVEQRVKAAKLDWTILRPSGFNQNFSEDFLLPGILYADEVTTTTGDGRVAFIDAEDIAAVAAAALTEVGHLGETYTLTGPESMSFAEAATMVGRAAGRPVGYRYISAAAFTEILVGAGLPADYAAIVVGNQEAIRDGYGDLVSDAVPQVTGRPAKRFAEYASGAAAAWARPPTPSA